MFYQLSAEYKQLLEPRRAKLARVRIKRCECCRDVWGGIVNLPAVGQNSAAFRLVLPHIAIILAQVTSFQALNAWTRNSRYCLAS